MLFRSMADSSLFGVIMQDSEDEDGQSSRSTIVRKNGAAYRVHKEVLVSKGDATEIVDYDPGFVRFDEAWATWEVGKEQEYEYLRDSSVDNGAEERVHRYKLLGLNETVEVPAGTFQCVHVSRMRLSGNSAGETVEFWYAKGVGKVRELRLESGKQELLKSFSIPGAR